MSLDMRPEFSRRTFNDRVNDLVLILWEREQFQRLLFATNNAQAVEGSMEIDDALAARMIRDEARARADEEVGNAKLATIVHALRVVLRRYNAGRTRR